MIISRIYCSGWILIFFSLTFGIIKSSCSIASLQDSAGKRHQEMLSWVVDLHNRNSPPALLQLHLCVLHGLMFGRGFAQDLSDDLCSTAGDSPCWRWPSKREQLQPAAAAVACASHFVAFHLPTAYGTNHLMNSDYVFLKKVF